jgi:hypothetical protein
VLINIETTNQMIMKAIVEKERLKCYLILFVLFFSGLFGCSKMDDTYKDFIKDGERIYVGRVDSLKTRAGLNRVQLSWLAISDRRVEKATVFWNNRTSSKDVPIQKTAGIDVIEVILTDMPEENYSFELITYDSNNNFSMPVNITSRVYGDQYVRSLYNRPILSVEKSTDALQINWDVASTGTVNSEIEYTDVSGVTRTIHAKRDESVTKIAGHKNNTSFKYRTLFKPEPLALDSVYTVFEVKETPLSESQLDKGLFSIFKLPGDTWEPNVAARSLNKIWDDKTTGAANSFNGKVDVGFPQHFTIDLGTTTKLTRMLYYPKAVNGDSYTTTARLFEIWGSNNPDPDGGWNNWVKLADCELIKPSGLPGSEYTPEDQAYCLAGINYNFLPGKPAVRYLRHKTISVWSGSNLNIYEITLYGIGQ